MYLNGVLIVEGKDDETLIKSILDVQVFKTDGNNIRTKDIKFLNEVAKQHKIIVLTDPDEAGERIRKRINESVANTFNVYLDKKMCDKHGKHGVAESTREHILERLKDHITPKSPKFGNLTKSDLMKYGLNGESKSKEKRDYICKHFSLGICNGKTILSRLNILNITTKDIEEALKSYGN